MHPVVSPFPGDEHGSFRLPDLVEVAPRQLGCGVHRRTPAGEEHLAPFDRAQRGDPVGQFQRGGVAKSTNRW